MAQTRDIATQLREAIIKSGLTPAEVARRAGLDRGAVWRFINPDPLKARTLTIDRAAKVAKALGLELRPVKPKKDRG